MPMPALCPISARCASYVCGFRVSSTCGAQGVNWSAARIDIFPVPTGYNFTEWFEECWCADDTRMDAHGFPMPHQPIYDECEDYEHDCCDHNQLIRVYFCGQLMEAGSLDQWSELYKMFVDFKGSREVVFEDTNNRMIRENGSHICYQQYP